jgi:hypothetical protein
VDMVHKEHVPPIDANLADADFIAYAMKLLATRQWLSGDVSIFKRIEGIHFQLPRTTP